MPPIWRMDRALRWSSSQSMTQRRLANLKSTELNHAVIFSLRS